MTETSTKLKVAEDTNWNHAGPYQTPVELHPHYDRNEHQNHLSLKQRALIINFQALYEHESVHVLMFYNTPILDLRTQTTLHNATSNVTRVTVKHFVRNT